MTFVESPDPYGALNAVSVEINVRWSSFWWTINWWPVGVISADAIGKQ